MTTHSLSHILARKAARERSVAEPVHGLGEGVEGVVVGGEEAMVVGGVCWWPFKAKGCIFILLFVLLFSSRRLRLWSFVPIA